MTVRTILLGGTDFISGEVLFAADLNDTFDEEYDNYVDNFGDGTADGLINAPVGTIIPWLKSLTGTPSIPSGWAECDGTGGTPNLNGTTDATRKFLRGTDGSTEGTGGTYQHAHSTNNHSYGGISTSFFTATTTVNALPPYHTVVMIIKTGV